MKTTALRCSFFLVLLLTLTACNQSSFTDTKGNAVSFESDNDEWLVLNFWADWCDPCRDEIPELNALAADGKVRVIGVDFDGSQGQELSQKVAALAIRFPVLEQSPLAHLGVSAPSVLPATLILNSRGQVVKTVYGPQTRKTLETQLTTFQERKSDD